MSTAITPSSGSPPFPIRKLTIDEYHRMIEVGILGEDDPVELLEGYLAVKMPHKPSHDATIDLLHELLQERLPKGRRVRIQSAITLEDSEPEPDLVIVPGPAVRYLDHHPGPEDVAVLIEVSDSSLSRDRNDKARLYARANVACYWIVNLVDHQVEVYSDPSGPDNNPHFRQSQTYDRQGAVPFVLDGDELGPIPVQDFIHQP